MSTTVLYTLSLHDALPISLVHCGRPATCPLPGVTYTAAHECPARHLRVKTDRKSTRLNSSHVAISYAVFCLKKKTVSEDCRVIFGVCCSPYKDFAIEFGEH